MAHKGLLQKRFPGVSKNVELARIVEFLTVDQEVGGSSPPSCTSKINGLAASFIPRESLVSALCPYSQCRAGLRHRRGRKRKGEREAFMSDEREDQERPCLHCMIVELIDDFFSEYPATAGSDKVDTDEQMKSSTRSRRQSQN
jgi:hypothetical protein